MPRSKYAKELQRKHALSCYSGGTIFFPEDSPFFRESLYQLIEELTRLTVEEANILSGSNKEMTAGELSKPVFESASTIDLYAKRIREEREKIGLTQEEVGNVLGISPEAICKKEEGKGKKIDPDDLLSFSLLFRVTPHYLVGLVSNPTEYLLTTSVIKALSLSCQHVSLSNDNQRKNIVAPMQFPSEAVRIRSQLILYRTLLDNPDLLKAFLRLATDTFERQKCTIARFRDLYALHEPYIEEAISKDFSAIWSKFIFQADVMHRHQEFSDALVIFETLGQRNFDCLDCLSRVACNKSNKLQEMICALIYESLRGETQGNLN